MSLCGLPLRGWAVVAPRRFHFTITALPVDRGSSSKAEVWQTDLLERCYPVTLPWWKSMSSSIRPFYCQCLSMEIAWLRALFYTPVSNGCGQNSQNHSFEGVSTSFSIYSVAMLSICCICNINLSCTHNMLYAHFICVFAYDLTCIFHPLGLPGQTSRRRITGFSCCHWRPLVSRPTRYSWGRWVGSPDYGSLPLLWRGWSSHAGNLGLLGKIFGKCYFYIIFTLVEELFEIRWKIV